MMLCYARSSPVCSMGVTLAVSWPARRSLDAEQVEGFCDVPTFIMGMSMGGALAVQTIRAVVSLSLLQNTVG